MTRWSGPHRDVEQLDWRTGEVVFSQKGVGVPSSWSDNAATIVTTKYFPRRRRDTRALSTRCASSSTGS